jgi:hypothetical protein
VIRGEKDGTALPPRSGHLARELGAPVEDDPVPSRRDGVYEERDGLEYEEIEEQGDGR